jgi:hypothetical protein
MTNLRELAEADFHAIRAAAEVQPSVNVDSKLLLALYAELDKERERAKTMHGIAAAEGDAQEEERERRMMAEASLSEKEREVERLKIALADAIRRPMGVIPASAEGLITYADVAAAEERRATLSQEPTNVEALNPDTLRHGNKRFKPQEPNP